ncbi:MAG: N-6 DNA methylase [Spirochaetales bacterium]
MSGLTDATKSAFRKLVTDLRTQLLADLGQALDQHYSLSAKDRSKVRLGPTDRANFALLETWQQTHTLQDLVKERAYTLLNRLVILMQLEARGLRAVKLISPGLDNSAFKDVREFFAALTQTDDRGFGYLLQQVWDELALELPALFAYSEVQEAVPIPGPTLIAVVTALADPELAPAWLDDTTLGWLYQYWNDPDRKAVDEKLNTTTGKVEAHELSDKTQLFTERYMVEWLVQNSLGAQWLALCAKNGWTTQTRDNTDFWKFYVDQPLSPETVAASPTRLEDVKILDPAMGSGHFLVCVFDFLWPLYLEQAQFTGQPLTNEQILDRILAFNLHGIDIDNRAVQIAAASLYLKTQQHHRGYRIRALNLVATDLGLGKVKKDDPALRTFVATLQTEVGLPQADSLKLIDSLRNADFMGSLLTLDRDIARITGDNALFGKKGNAADAQSVVLAALRRFIHDHDGGEDLGVRSLAEQLGKGLRLIEMLGRKYDLIVANPPYLGLAKADEGLAELLQANFVEGKTDMFSVFMVRSLVLLRPHGRTAMITPRGWMFLSSFEELRLKLLSDTSLVAFGDLDQGAFSDMKDVSVTMFIVENAKAKVQSVQFRRPVKKQEIRRDQYQIGRNIEGLQDTSRTYSFPQERFAEIPGSPMIYWWPEEFRSAYLKAKKLGEVGEVRQGMASSINSRFLRLPFEVSRPKIEINGDFLKTQPQEDPIWQPYLKGAAGGRWFDGLSDVIRWKSRGKEVRVYAGFLYGSETRSIKSQDRYFGQGVAYSDILTDGYLCRLRKYRSVFDVTASTIFGGDPAKLQVILSSNLTGFVAQALNPTIHNQVGDTVRLPVLDLLQDHRPYLARAEALYEQLFASTESNLEYRYEHLSPETFEVEEARIRHEIDTEIFAHFSPATVAAIYEEIGPSPYLLPAWDGVAIPPNFAEAYQASDSILALAQQFGLHPDGVLAIKDKLKLVHPERRREEAFKHLSWALGVLLGRFDAGPDSPPQPHGFVYLSTLDDLDGVDRPAGTNLGPSALGSLQSILRTKWGEPQAGDLLREIDAALVTADKKRTLNEWLRQEAFDRHKKLYENRPIYFPLVSAKKNFWVYASIHRWTDGTLNAILANALRPDLQTLVARLARLREEAQRETNKARRNDLENEVDKLDKLREELAAFTALVTRLAEKGPDPAKQEVEAPYAMDLDDGVMVSSAALWELVAPLWKEPKKWWDILSAPAGKKDYDWSHLAMRYWPSRVWEKLKKDPSLAVAHSDYGAHKGRDLFEELHPAAAKKWKEQQEKSKQMELE